MRLILSFILILVLCLAIPPVTAGLPGGGISVIFKCPDSFSSTTSCNANGATVLINGVSKGAISGDTLEIPYDDSYTSYEVSRSGYYSLTGSIPAPAPGQTADITIEVTLTQKPAGNGKGWITVHANTDGATVAFDGVTKGTIQGGVFTHEVSATGTPYAKFTVSKTGYMPYEGEVPSMPAEGATVDLYATLNPVPTSVPTMVPTTAGPPIGGDAGWYTVISNVDDATVYFDNARQGVITAGKLSVQVYSTGTPFKTYRVEKTGYVTATGSLPQAPGKGQTVTVPVSLAPVSGPVPTTVPTTMVNPPGSEHGYIAIHSNVDGATVTVGENTVGTIKNGVLTIPVATTGTPFSAFAVSKPGYTTATGTIPRQPSAGETVDMYVTLTEAKPTPVPTTRSPLSLPIIGAGILCAIALCSRR